MNVKPLFLPLMRHYFEAFARGEKRTEFRQLSKRWNLNKVTVGRPVTLSSGYGSHSRLQGVVDSVKTAHSSTLPEEDRAAVLECYGGDVELICIGIRLEENSNGR